MSSFFKSSDQKSPAPQYSGEPTYCFFDRVTGDYWDEVRQVADEFLNRVPESARKDIISRWRSNDEREATSAWWEVYLHEWLIRSGFSVQVHEEQTNGTAPDFKATRNGLVFYLEATGPGLSKKVQADLNRKADFYKHLNQVKTQEHALWVKKLVPGTGQIAFKKWREEIQKWIDEINRGSADLCSSLLLEENGWRAEVAIWSRRTLPDPSFGPRAVAVYAPEGGGYDSEGEFRKLVNSKRKKYGKLDAPLVIAIWGNEHLRRPRIWHDVLFEAMVGVVNSCGDVVSEPSNDGLWGSPAAWRNQHVGGILVGLNPAFHYISRLTPRWIPHPGSTLTSSQQLLSPFAKSYTFTPESEDFIVEPARQTPSEFFGLPDPWPSVGDPWKH